MLTSTRIPAAVIVGAALTACGGGQHVADPSSTQPAPSMHTAAPAAPPSAAAVARQQSKPWVDLQAGDCLVDMPPTDPSVVMVTTVDCATPHRAEAFYRGDVAVNDAVAGVADQACASGLVSYTGHPAAGSSLSVTYLIDSRQDRTSNNPEPSSVICVLYAADGTALSGSARR
ncbi:hypothetical protein [Mycolicibacterium brisbanense]|uniref:hypothetical protein n=1 Tax=Mycolicibacterium brisbanense TaxID=146020 RepID=UPI000A5EECD6|nr:hypothetical protein [Mycolicibacterium brisbanense]MCV7161665.1 hypothetical protein [Mycolicibacterium brisbanense]